MGLMCVASAKGAPGATTTALALGALWPRDVVVAECDTSGADVPLRMSDAEGGVLNGDKGVLSLGAAARRGLTSDLVLDHTQVMSGGLPVLVGPRGPHQAAGLTHLWSSLAPALDGIEGYDVIADCGRLTGEAGQNMLLRTAKLLVVVTTARPSDVAHARQAITTLSQSLDSATPNGTPLGVVVVAPVKANRQVQEVRQVMERTDVPLRGVWHVARDAGGAGFFAGDGRGRPDRTPLVRTARSVASEAAALMEPFHRARTPIEAEDAAGAADQPPLSRRERKRRRKAEKPEVSS